MCVEIPNPCDVACEPKHCVQLLSTNCTYCASNYYALGNLDGPGTGNCQTDCPAGHIKNHIDRLCMEGGKFHSLTQNAMDVVPLASNSVRNSATSVPLRLTSLVSLIMVKYVSVSGTTTTTRSSMSVCFSKIHVTLLVLPNSAHLAVLLIVSSVPVTSSNTQQRLEIQSVCLFVLMATFMTEPLRPALKEVRDRLTQYAILGVWGATRNTITQSVSPV